MKKNFFFILPLLIVILISGCEKPFCGDSKCEKDESSANCCIDCGCPSGHSCDNNACKKLEECGNEICGEGETSLNCCQDCGCDTGFNCINSKCKSTCGDGIKSSDETSENCCEDAGCPTGETCQNNVCVVLKPEISGTFTQTTESYSVTFLKAKGDNIGQIVLSNSGNDDASNTKVVLSSPNGYFSDKTISFGTIRKRDSSSKNVDLNFLDKALDVTTDEDITLKTDITFYNSANKKYSSKESFKMHIAGRNYMTWGKAQMIASWVTPTQPTIREFASKATSGLAAGMDSSNPTVQKMAARWLFESMRSYGVRYVNDAHSSADYIQFPIETLRNKAGDCDDNAVMYSSLLESIGLKSFLVLVPGHIFSGYIDSTGKAVPVETTSSNFESALSSGEYQYNKYKDSKDIIYPTKEWRNYPQVNLPEKTSISMPSITKQIGECGISFTFSEGFVAKVDVSFVNNGNAAGAGCAAVEIYNEEGLRDSEYNCWTLVPGESKQVTFKPDISIFEGYSCRSY